ncbi:hypothetical protein, partial [Pseudomonas sp. WS 5407]|uniref:hypothetical protein n=1 Tax=Pseudomonas sp. WS 5407 TaxID=2717496 RepID=UPI0021CCF9B3
AEALSLTELNDGALFDAEFGIGHRGSTVPERSGVALSFRGRPECGDPVGTSITDLPINEQVLQFQCMKRNGFIRKDGFEYCEVMKDMPACVEERQGHPLSLSQLEALPFVEDEAFHPIKPNSGRDERMQVTWRKAGASPHFSVQIANDSEALPVMYACGYAKPLGSNLDVASIGDTAKAQRCMIDHGFEPKHKSTLVCLIYPQVSGCPSTALPR